MSWPTLISFRHQCNATANPRIILQKDYGLYLYLEDNRVGVPQGLCLGPLQFLFNINEIVRADHEFTQHCRNLMALLYTWKMTRLMCNKANIQAHLYFFSTLINWLKQPTNLLILRNNCYHLLQQLSYLPLTAIKKSWICFKRKKGCEHLILAED